MERRGRQGETFQRTVLLIDPSEAGRVKGAAALDALGLVPRTASDVFEALALVEQPLPHLVVQFVGKMLTFALLDRQRALSQHGVIFMALGQRASHLVKTRGNVVNIT